MEKNDAFRYQNISLPEDIAAVKAHGDFDKAIQLIDRRLEQQSLPEAMRFCLCVHREMILRTKQYYPYTRQSALEIIQEKVPDFTEAELDEFMADRKILWRYINGEERFHSRFFPSLCKGYPDFSLRAGVKIRNVGDIDKLSNASGNEEHLLDRCIRLMQENGKISQRIRMRSTLRLKDEHFKPGMVVRVHLPIPAKCETQSDIVIERMFPEGGVVAPETAPARTIYWEETMTENHEFVVEYSYTHTEYYTDAYSGKHSGYTSQPDFCLEEEPPHIVFTPYIRELTHSLTDVLDNPLDKARAIYDFITLNMKYAFVPSYFILENMADNCARTGCGDCGILALLFITMCRCVGIPAQWQSGLAADPGFCCCHDWARFYVAPYGWLHTDPSFGTGGVRANNETRRRFYFGNIDHYRMVANNAFAAPLHGEKKHWRADPYDNQLGEIETDESGFDYPEFETTKGMLSCEEL